MWPLCGRTLWSMERWVSKFRRNDREPAMLTGFLNGQWHFCGVCSSFALDWILPDSIFHLIFHLIFIFELDFSPKLILSAWFSVWFPSDFCLFEFSVQIAFFFRRHKSRWLKRRWWTGCVAEKLIRFTRRQSGWTVAWVLPFRASSHRTRRVKFHHVNSF